VNPATQMANPMARDSPAAATEEEEEEPCCGAMCQQWGSSRDNHHHDPTAQGMPFWEILLGPLPPSEVRFRKRIPKVFGGF
jgi:hypothetical protein